MTTVRLLAASSLALALMSCSGDSSEVVAGAPNEEAIATGPVDSSMPAAAPSLPAEEELRYDFSGAEYSFVTDPSLDVKTTSDEAVTAARSFLNPPEDAVGNPPRVTFQLGRFSHATFGEIPDTAGDDLSKPVPRFDNTPAWVVTYHDIVQEAEGPAGAPEDALTPQVTDLHVVVDAMTGEALLGIADSTKA